MKTTENTGIYAKGFALSNASGLYISLVYMAMLWGMMLILIPLAYFFPWLKEWDWLVTLPYIFVGLIFLGHMLCCFYSVVLEPDGVTVKWLGMPVRRIPASALKLFCAVGNLREDVLCLSCHSAAEMAQMQEKRLLRNPIKKHDVPLMKRGADWQNLFAREYLNGLRKNPFGLFRAQGVVMFNIHPALQCGLRQMYPGIPYKNYTGVSTPHASRYGGLEEDRAVCIAFPFGVQKVRMELEGIRIVSGKREVSFLPAGQIKTAVRVDVFRGYDKNHPHHTPLLYISALSEEELAALVPHKGFDGFRMGNETCREVRAMAAATHLALRWTADRKDSCVVYHTGNNLDAVQSLYPNVRINETSADWLEDSPALSPCK